MITTLLQQFLCCLCALSKGGIRTSKYWHNHRRTSQFFGQQIKVKKWHLTKKRNSYSFCLVRWRPVSKIWFFTKRSDLCLQFKVTDHWQHAIMSHQMSVFWGAHLEKLARMPMGTKVSSCLCCWEIQRNIVTVYSSEMQYFHMLITTTQSTQQRQWCNLYAFLSSLIIYSVRKILSLGYRVLAIFTSIGPYWYRLFSGIFIGWLWCPITIPIRQQLVLSTG